MARKLLLCLSTFNVTAALARGRRVGPCTEFEDDEEGHTAFHAYLRRLSGVPVYLMVDTVDEDYRLETLPHASGRDRRDLLERKLRQIYRNSSFVGAALQSRETERRRDDRYLLAAVTNAEIFDPWLRHINSQRLPVAGVFPLPLVSLGLIKLLDLRERNVLLVSSHSAGVRQTFIRDQRFRISRLTPVRLGDAASSGESYAEEVKNTRMYLDALNITHVDDQIQVLVLDQDGSLGGLAEAIETSRRNLTCRYLGPSQLVALAGLTSNALQQSRDALHLLLLARRAPSFNIAPANLLVGFEHYRARGLIHAACALALLLTSAWTGVQVWRAAALTEEAGEVAGNTAHQQALYQEITRSFPPAPTSAEPLRQTVEVAERIESLARTPEQVFQIVSQALERSPAIALQGLLWRRAAPAAAGSEGAPDPTGPFPGQWATLQLELRGYTGGYRGALGSIDQFVAELARSEAVAEAKASRLPLNLNPSGTLSGSTASARQEQPKTAQFEVQLLLKPGV